VDQRSVQFLRLGAGKPRIPVSAPLHRSAHSIAVAQINVVAHPDFVAVVEERRAGEREEKAVEELDAAAIVVDERSQAAANAEIDAHSGICAVGDVHVIALVAGDHLEGQLIVVAEEKAPLAVVRDGGSLGDDVGDGEAVFLAQSHVDARH